MSLLMRRRMLIAQQKKSTNLFNEELLLSGYANDNKDVAITKVSDGYEVMGYPASFGKTSALITHLKSVIKPNTDYTIAREVLSIGPSAAGGIYLFVNGKTLFSVGAGGTAKYAHTFNLTQEQIDGISAIYVYGTSLTSLNTGKEKTIYKYIQLVEGAYTKDTLPPYEPYEE